MNCCIEINGRKIGPGHPVYIIAEMSGNHGQSFDQAVRILEAAKDAGADAVKLQTYTADTLTIRCDNKHFRIQGSPWAGRTLHDLYSEAFTPWEWQPKLKETAENLGLDLFSTPFDKSAVDFLEQMEVPAHKIASFENCDLPLLRRVARTGKPIIVSTGMATLEELTEAVETIREAGGQGLALLKCTSAYPAPPEEMNLRTIPDLADVFDVPVGISDHTLGLVVPITAVSLGASIIEKHLTLSRAEPGPDSAFSLEPEEFKAMVESVRSAEKAMGAICYGVSPAEEKSRVFRRSLFVVEDIQAGELFTPRNLKSIRPSGGLAPRYLESILGAQAACDIKRGTPLAWDLVVGNSDTERVRNSEAKRAAG
jgi:N-acetylneuraminate synthase